MTQVDRDTLVLEHLPMVRDVLGRMWRDLPRQVRFTDLEQAGRIALLQAASRFDPSRGDATFRTFASWHVMGAIWEECHAVGVLSRSYRRRHAGTALELTWTPVLSQRFSAEPVFTDGIGERWIRRAIRALPSRERDIVTAYYLQGKMATVIAAEMGLSPSRVRQLRGRGLHRLRRAMARTMGVG